MGSLMPPPASRALGDRDARREGVLVEHRRWGTPPKPMPDAAPDHRRTASRCRRTDQVGSIADGNLRTARV